MSTHHHDHCDHTHCHDHGPTLGYGRKLAISVCVVVAAIILLRPMIVNQMYQRASSYAMYNMHAHVERMCKKILLIDPNHMQAWMSLGVVYADEKKSTQAQAAFLRVLEINPHDQGLASYMLGFLSFQAKDYAKAILYFERVRLQGDKADAALDVEVLKYRHGPSSMRNLRNYAKMLGMLEVAYAKLGDGVALENVRREIEAVKIKHKGRIF